jgi:hypothetical protein
MLSRLTARIAPIAILGATLAIGVVPAHADLNIYLQEDAGQIVLVGTAANFTSVSFSGTFGPLGIGGMDFRVTIDGASSDNGGTLSDLLSSDNAIANISGATHTLHVWASQNDYTLPAGSPLLVESSMGGSVNVPTLTLSSIFQAYADRNNNLLGTPFPGPAITDFTNGTQNAIPNGTAFDTGSVFGFFSRTGNYSLTQVSNIRLTAGGIMNFSAHENLTPVPEPSTMAIAGLGALGLIGYGLLRRRA